MSEAVAPAPLSGHPSPTETPGFWRIYIFSRDHKMIGKQFLLLSGVMLVCGGLLAMLMRWELAWPETPLPLIGASQQFIDGGETQTAMDKTWQEWLAQDETEQNWLARNMPTGAVTPAFYN